MGKMGAESLSFYAANSVFLPLGDRLQFIFHDPKMMS